MNPTSTDAFLPGPRVHIPGAASGPLAGMTFAAKDLFDVAGHPTGGGNPDWERMHPVPTRHAWAVQALLDAGATLVGKTVTDEVSLGILGENAFFGTPANPAAPGRVPGGSSSGSASAVLLAEQVSALGVGPITHIAALTGTGSHWPALADLVAPQSGIGIIDDPKSVDAGLLKRKSASLHWDVMFTRPVFETANMAEQGWLLADVASLVDRVSYKQRSPNTTTRLQPPTSAARTRPSRAAAPLAGLSWKAFDRGRTPAPQAAANQPWASGAAHQHQGTGCLTSPWTAASPWRSITATALPPGPA